MPYHAIRRPARLLSTAILIFAASLNAQSQVRSGDYIVHSWTSSDALARRVIEVAESFDSFPGLPREAPGFGQPINIYLAQNDAQFRALTANLAPEWGVAVAAPAQGVIVMRAYGGSKGAFARFNAILRHELAHIALHRYLGGAGVPRWFDEGYATVAAGEFDSDAAWQLRIAFASGRAPTLEQLELSWPAMATDARIAYTLAGSAAEFLMRGSTREAFAQFMRSWREQHDFHAALGQTYGLSLDQLEKHWRADVKRRYGWLLVVTQTSVAFSILALVTLLLFMIRRRRDRARLELLKATEPPDLPDYWNEDANRIDDGGEERQL